MKKIQKQFLAGVLSLGLAFNGILPAFAETEEESTQTIAEETVESAESVSEETPAEPIEEEPRYSYSLSGVGDIVNASSVAYGPAATLYKYFCQTNGVMSQTVYSAVIDPSRGGILRGVSLGGRVGGRGVVSSLTNENEDEQLLAAVNADFFSTATGVPLGVFMEDGRFVSSSDGNAAIGFDKKGNAFIGYVGDSISLTHSGDDYPVSYLNKYPTVYGVYLLTRDFGETTYLSDSVPSTEYIIELSEDIVFGERVRGKVTEIRNGVSNGEIPEDCAVLVVPDAYQHASFYKEIEKGDRVYIEAECDELFEKAISAVGGGDILLEDGEISESIGTDSLATARHPRTAVGITADGRVIMTVIDGRQSGYSNGVSLTSLAEAMRAQGAVSALNFDGGGSSTFVVFTDGGGTLVNKPSDKTERKVPAALAAYADTEEVSELHTLYADIEHSLILSGVKIPISLTLVNGEGEEVEFTPDEDNVSVTVDELFGSYEIADGEIYFIAGGSDGYGNVHIEIEHGDETLFADVYLSVTTEIDSLTVDETLLVSDTDKQMNFSVTAMKGEKEVYIGEELGVMCENEQFLVYTDGTNVTLSLVPIEAAEEPTEPEETEETEETEATEKTEVTEETVAPAEEAEVTEATEVTDIPEDVMPEETVDTRPAAAHGRVAVWLLDKTVVIPAYFDNELSLSLDAMLRETLSLSLDTHTIEYVEDGGVMGEGAFVIAPVPVETTEVSETTEAPEAPETTEVVETSEVSETTEAPETTEVPEETVETSDVSEVSDDTEETAIPEEEPKIPEGVTVFVNSDAVVSRGLSARRIWLWADGLDVSANPYAVFKVTDGEGNVREETVYYEMFYDFLAFNGRALLTLSLEYGEDERAALVSPLVYTAFDLEKEVVFGNFILSEELDTNLYADTAEHWSSYYVNSLSYMGIVNGSEVDGKQVFRPDDKLSREQFAKILVNYLKLDTEDYSEIALEFEDSEEISDWAVPYVRAVLGASLMRGRETITGTIVFAPSDPITREEAFYVLGGLFDSADGEEVLFTDGEEIAPWAKENLSKLFILGLVSGYDDGTVRPKGNITRAEAATVVVRIADLAANS